MNEFQTLQRKNTKLYINLFGLAGSGKTYSSMLIATQLASSNDKVLIIDTESRASIYADDFQGIKVYQGNDINIDKIIDIIDNAKKQNFECIIIDSLTPLWDGKIGILTLAMNDINNKHGKNWLKPKQKITSFTQLLKNCGMHIITTTLGKEEVDENLKKTGTIEPIFERSKFEPYLDLQLLLKNNGSIEKIHKSMHPVIKQKLIENMKITKELVMFIKNWIGFASDNDNEIYNTNMDDIKNNSKIEDFFNQIKDFNNIEFKDWFDKLLIQDKKLYSDNAIYIKDKKNIYQSNRINQERSITLKNIFESEEEIGIIKE